MVQSRTNNNVNERIIGRVFVLCMGDKTKDRK
jgi:hypothetical protein